MSAALGRALLAAWPGRSTGRAAPPASTWRAQIRELGQSARGHDTLRSAGVSTRSVDAWRAKERQPNQASQDKIDSAYGRWFTTRRRMGPILQLPTTAVHAITGRVVIGNDDRDRGMDSYEPIRIDGDDGDWTEIEIEWRRFNIDPSAGPLDGSGRGWDDVFAGLFISDVIVEDLDISDSSFPDFPGTSYHVGLER